MSSHTFLWHDYETFGTRPRRDWPAQFAAIRTDAELNEVSAALMFYCQPPHDRLPAPQACLITGITPQECAEKGLPEHEFAARINAELARPDTVGVGYNSIRFDDEVTRFLLWRNLIDPYGREWRDGCARWDLIDAMRCAYALRPDGIHWPQGDNGKPSFRLEKLTAANGIAHEQAHDALSDVRATIALARLLRSKQRKLFDFCLALRSKARVAQELGLPTTLQDARPFLHVSSRFDAAHGCIAVMAPLAMHPVNRNQLIAWDLAADPTELADLTPDQVRQRLFAPSAEMPEGMTRLALKSVHLNRAPVVIGNTQTLTPPMAERWGIDRTLAAQNLDKLRALPDLSALWQAVYASPRPAVEVDVDEDLYGGFVSDADRRRLQQLRALDPQELALANPGFDDDRLPELLLRYRARNFPQTLAEPERQEWLAHCRRQLMAGDPPAISSYFDSIDALADAHPSDAAQDILSALYDWGEQLAESVVA